MTVRDARQFGGGLTGPDSLDGPDAPDATSGGGSGDGPRRQSAPAGVLAFGRNTWRQLTSMRTALILLFLLALASLPGALLPQWSLNTAKTA